MGFLRGITKRELPKTLRGLHPSDVACKREKDGTYVIAWDVPLGCPDAGTGLKSSSSSSLARLCTR